MLYRKSETLPITACQQSIFATALAAVYRTDRVNHVFRLANFIGRGDLRMARFAAAQSPAFLQEIRASRTVNGSIDSAASL